MKAIKQFYIISLSIFTLVVSHAQQPVAHWTFDNQNAEDVSGNGFHGTLTNVKFNKGINCDTAVWFTGISSYVNFGDILDTLFTKGTFSISMWAYPQARVDDNGYTGFLMQKWFTSSSSNNAFILRLFRFDGNNKAMSFHPLDLNVWSHIAVSVDNGNASIYINGQMVAQDSGFVFNASSQPLRLGNLHNNHYEYTGGIDDVRIYNEALSVQQINDLIKLNGFYDQYTTDIILEAGNELIIGPERRAGFNYSWNTGSNESQINIHSATADTTTFSLEIEDLENCTVQDTIKVIWYELENHKLARWTFNDSLELEATAAINGAIVDTGIMCSNSFYFDGDDAYISLGDTLGTYFSGIEDISISLWVNLMDTIDPDGYPAMILSKWKTSGST
ncbi:MAG: LamG domain-containing protein, partial [Bacteroidota bacterium]